MTRPGLGLCVVLAACPGPDADAACDEAPSVELGDGELAHAALEDGDEVVMVHGPQGGWHVWISLAFTRLDPQVDVHVTLVDLTRGDTMTELTYELLVPDAEGCTFELAGLFGFLPYDDLTTPEDESPPVYRACDTFRVCVDVLDVAGRTASDCAEVIAVPDPADGSVSC